MAIYNSPLTDIDQAETRRYAGLRGNTSFPDQLVEQACQQVLLLARPQASWQIYPYEAATGTILAATPHVLGGTSIRRHLSSALQVAVLAVTIGSELEPSVNEHFSSGSYSAALLLDAAGTTAVETVADAANHMIHSQVARQGLRTVTRFSPGYGDWPITEQATILALADGATIGITVTPTAMLQPRKSVTAVIGMTAGTPLPAESSCEQRCQSCTLKNCLSRKEPQP